MRVFELKYIDLFYEFSDKLKNKEFPIKQIPFNDIRTILMNCFPEKFEWWDYKLKNLKNYMEQEDYEAGSWFFYDIAQIIQGLGNQSLNLFKETASTSFRIKVLSEYGENKWFKGKGVVYTVVTGNYDSIKEPEFVNTELDYICFTDNINMKSKVWQMRELKDEDGIGPQRLSRKPKILVDEFLGGYEYSIYVDAKFRITGDLNEYANRYSMGAPMLCFPHFLRDCVYDEAKVCIFLGKDKESVISGQVERYREKGLPEHYGLIDAGCMVRVHDNQAVIEIMEGWWKEFSGGCCRDQLGFPYVCWKNKFKYDICDLYINNNKYLRQER